MALYTHGSPEEGGEAWWIGEMTDADAQGLDTPPAISVSNIRLLPTDINGACESDASPQITHAVAREGL